jgi:uncharacterized membrane protein YeaQ/YmgE (transglycosylase-associated protein family)
MRVLTIIAAAIGTFVGRTVGCDKILFDAAFDRWGPDLGEAIKGMHVLCNEGTKFLLGSGLIVGILAGYLADRKGHPRLSPVVSLIFGFLGTLVAAFLYGKLWSP